MENYQNLVKDVLENGEYKESARKGLPGTYSLFGTRLEFNLLEGFPILTTKRMFWKGIVVELLWFLQGRTDLKYLVDRGVNIWNKDAYRFDSKKAGVKFDDLEDYKNYVRFKNEGNLLGDLGNIYGYQWRRKRGDQVQDVIDKIQTNPYGRYKIIDAWSPEDFDNMALPPCHLLYQFNCVIRDGVKFLDMQMYQRSVDTFLGLPFNLSSGALLLSIIAKITGSVARRFIWIGGDTHIYENHIDACQELLERDPYDKPELRINRSITSLEDIEERVKHTDFELVGYNSHDKIFD